MSIALILTVCAALSTGDDCVKHIVKKYHDVDACTQSMSENIQVKDDRYLSCGGIKNKYLIDRTNGRSVSAIIEDINNDGL